MTQKTVGYVELEWTCTYCGTRNPGTQKKCSGCGAMMGEEDQFEAPVQQELITDEAKLAQAKRGLPDIHCPYCGTRNVARSEKCKHCGGDLTGAVEREKGRVVGAYREGPVADVPCPYCGTPNPANAVKCKKCGGTLQKPVETPLAEPPPAAPAATPKPRSRFAGIAIGAVALLCIVAAAVFFILSGRTTDTPAVVQSVLWERSIEIMEERPVTHEDWEDQIPSGAVIGSCSKEYRRTQSEPAPGAEEVCGTPYTIDQGDGTGKVVQDCEYRIYDNRCEYTVNEWTVVDRAVMQGSDLNPQWPRMSLQSGQREGNQAEEYVVTFRADDSNETYTYHVDSADEFSRFNVGSYWTLKVNTFGDVTGAEPAK
jgi:ribosomal protein L40E